MDQMPESGEMVFVKELKNLMVVPVSGYHFPAASDRIQSLIDPNAEEYGLHAFG